MTDEALDYLDDIIYAAEKIDRFTDGMTSKEFQDDEKTVDAVLRNLEIIGEATKNLPESVHHKYDDVPWSEMAGMRDKLIHGYMSVDLDIVWTTVEKDVPALQAHLETVRDDVSDAE